MGIAIIFLVLGLLIGALIGAVILRASVALYNKLAGGSERGVPEPSMGQAMGIAIVVAIVNSLAQFVVGLLVGTALANSGMEPRMIAAIAQLISLPISFLTLAGMLSLLLPTSFGKAFLVSLCYLVVVLLIVGVLTLLFLLLGLATMLA